MDWKEIDKINIRNRISISCFKTNNENISEQYDLGIIFSSSESRALEYKKLFSGKSFNDTLLIKFLLKQPSDLRERNDLENYKILKKISKNKPTVIDNLNIEDIKENIYEIIMKIPKVSFRVNSQWFLDMTGAPSVYSLSILGFLKGIYPAPNIHLLNVSGRYTDKKNIANSFTEGYREDIWVPFFIGEPDWKSPSLFIFLLGFEGNRALSIYKRCEPVFVEAIIADPGYQKNYKTDALEKNNYFLREVNIPNNKVVTADVGNPIEVHNKIKRIVKRYKDRYKNINIVYVPIGPKPHALGASISAIEDKTSSILYEIPNSYTLKEVERNKFIWLYKIIF